MEHQQAIASFAGGGCIENRMSVDAPQARRILVVGIDRGDLGDPCEVRQVEIEQGILEVVAGRSSGEVATVARCGRQVRPQHDLAGAVRCLQFVQEPGVDGESVFVE